LLYLDDNLGSGGLEPQLRGQGHGLDVREVIFSVKVTVLAVTHGCKKLVFLE
jgi:hypothetical protein